MPIKNEVHQLESLTKGSSRLCVIIFAYGIVKCLLGKTFRTILRIFYQYRPRFHTETRRAGDSYHCCLLPVAFCLTSARSLISQDDSLKHQSFNFNLKLGKTSSPDKSVGFSKISTSFP
jgi:hypothetical protein